VKARAFIDNKDAISYFPFMAQMNISIPEKLKEWVELRVAGGDYASVSDYLRDLVRQDQRELLKLEHLRAAIEQGRASGISEKDPFELIGDLRDRARLTRHDAA
jgi:antitoxin ParD1/3/4